MKVVVVGTRGSPLALAQTKLVAEQLEGEVEIRIVRTQGDLADRPLHELGDGVFVTALEDALRAGEIDVAVHSLKDLPTESPTTVPTTEERADLVIAAVPERADPSDVLLTAGRDGLAGLRARGVVGTSSPRRAAFLHALRPDAVTRDIRGNVGTRLRKVLEGEYDGTVLALAGLRRLGIEVFPVELLDLVAWPPAPGQGALAVQCRAADLDLRARLGSLDDHRSRTAVNAERALLRLLGASCAIPLGAWARYEGPVLVMDATLALPDGIRRVRVEGAGPLEVAAAAARGLGQPAHA